MSIQSNRHGAVFGVREGDASKAGIDASAGIPFGAGADASFEKRPGVPAEKARPEPAGNAHWLEPDRMPDPGFIQVRKGHPITPVFGTCQPPKGISGLMRRAAYQIPEHYTSHWLVLLLADRVDALEARAKELVPFALPVAAAGFAAYAIATRRKRSLVARFF